MSSALRFPRNVALATALLLATVLAPAAPADDSPPDLAAAEVALAEYNYQTALDGFSAWLAGQPDPTAAPAVDVQHKMVECHLYLGRYDDALARMRGLVAGELADPVLRGEVERTLGELYLSLPGGAYRRGGELFFDPDEYDGEYVYRWEENQRAGLTHLGRAKLWFDGALRAQQAGVYAADEDLARRVIEFDLALAERLELSYVSLEEGGADSAAEAGPDLPAGATYDPRWPAFDQVLFLYDEARALSDGAGDPAGASWALYRKALFLNSGYMSWPETVPKEPPEGVLPRPPLPDPPPTPLALLDELLAAYPGDPREDLYVYSHARFLLDQGEFSAAEAELDAFLTRFPDSAWAGDTRYDLQELRRPQLQITTVGVVAPGGGTELPIRARNLDRVVFSAHRVDLLAVLGNGARLRNAQVGFADFQRNFGRIDGVRKHYLEEVGAWTVELGDPGDRRWLDGHSPLPLPDPGAYVVEATGGGVDSTFLVIVSDVTVLVRRDEGGALIFVADALTGEPLEAFPLIVKETYWDFESRRGRYRTRLTRALSGPDGAYRHPGPAEGAPATDTLAVLAAEGDRLAVTGDLWLGMVYGYGWGFGDVQDTKAFTTTDRPVYRPGQTVHFKHVIRAVQDGAYVNLPGARVRAIAYDAQGDTIHDELLTASEYGSVHGSFTLGEEPPLGVYSLALEFPDTQLGVALSSGSTFRVEEYRKPEFEVAVTPAATEGRPGAPVPVEIQATYLFGAPVDGARVVYRVFRTPFSYRFHRPGPYDWLYGAGYGTVHERPFAYGEEWVDEGELITDEDGRATLLLEPPEGDELDFTYDVQVEVTDLARRTLQGSGRVTVTRQPFFAAVDSERGFYSPGDTVELEVRAETPGGVPVPAEGTLELFRVTRDDSDEEVLTRLDERTLLLDEHGRVFTEFVPDEAGTYRAVFRSPTGDVEEGKPPVEARRELWVHDETFPGQRVRFANLELVTDRRHYEGGETLRLMVQSPFADPTVLLTLDGAADLIEHRVLSLEGNSTVVEIPLGDAHVPNFFVRAAMARDYQVFHADREIFVPPADRFLQVELTGDRPDFRPGGEGTFTVTVRDRAGEPVQGEFSLAAVDRAVYAIQRETAGDLRSYFHGDRRHGSATLEHSRGYYPYPLQRDRNRHVSYPIQGLPYTGGYAWGLGWGGGGYFGHGEMGFGRGGGGIVADGLYAAGPTPSTVAMEPVPREAMMEIAPVMTRDGRGDMGGEKLADTGLDLASVAPVRSDFRDTAHWEPAFVTDGEGRATVAVHWPDSLTTWDVVVRGVDQETRVGGARVDAVTTKEVLVRLLAPRFLVEEDRLLLTAIVNNRGVVERQAAVSFELPEGALLARGPAVSQVTVPAGGQVRVDLPVEVLRPGDATVVARVDAGGESDAVQGTTPVLTWGAEKMLTRSTVLRDGGRETLTFEVPRERRGETAVLTVQLNPSLASVMLDAVPYLVDYPYGCVEQTMSRFMPAALVAGTLDELGVDFADIRAAARQPGVLGEEAAQLAVWDDHPVTSRRVLDRVVRRSMSRLVAFQHADGGWGWWKGGDSDPFMTAYVVDGLQVAADGGYAVDAAALGRGYQHLKRRFAEAGEDDDPARDHRRVYMAYVLSGRQLIGTGDLDAIFDARNRLSTYGKSLLALTLHRLGDHERAGRVVENLAELARVDDGGSASFDHDEGGAWWAWYNDRVETNAWALRAFLAVDPDSPLCDGLMRWLVNNRRGNRWHDTRDTAQVVVALAGYIRSRDELSPDMGLTVRVNGAEVHEARVNRANLFRTRSQLVLTGDAIVDGTNTVEVETAGKGSLYVTAHLTYFTREKRIAGSGHRIHVTREYAHLTPKAGQRDSDRGEIDVLEYDRKPLRDGARVASGDRIEVRIEVESDNRYEYLVFEDFKPAGFEAVEVKSGHAYDNGTWYNLELRDERVVFFLDRLRQGTQVLDYQLRAETPGTFRALPHAAHAMYAPRIRAISDSFRVTVDE